MKEKESKNPRNIGHKNAFAAWLNVNSLQAVWISWKANKNNNHNLQGFHAGKAFCQLGQLQSVELEWAQVSR